MNTRYNVSHLRYFRYSLLASMFTAIAQSPCLTAWLIVARRVWNREDLRTKLVVLGPPLGPNADRRNEVREAGSAPASLPGSSCSGTCS
jgi:hypothetical protein